MALTDGLVALYHFNGNWQDSQGANHGTAYGATFDAVNQKLGSHAGSFDGIDDKVSLPPANFPGGNASRSVAAWIKSNDTDQDPIIFTYGSPEGWWTNDIQLVYITSLGPPPRAWFGRVGLYAKGTSGIGDNLWHLLVGTWDGVNFKVYVDNVLEGAAPSAAFDTPLQSCTIGSNPLGYSTYKGLIDELAVWNRALTTDEVSQLWNNGVGVEVGVEMGAETVTNPFVPRFVRHSNITKAVKK